MAISLKRVLFFLSTTLVLGASPALSVPLSTGLGSQGTAVYGASGVTDPDGEATQAVDGSAEQTSSEARIVDHQVAYSSASASKESGPHSDIGMSGQASMGSGGGGMPGWILPAGAIGAGGALYAVISHKGHEDTSASSGLSSSPQLGTAGSGGVNLGNGGQGDDPPSAVPEPGTILLMGAGIASLLGRRKILGR
jgi:hypothetical protein